MAKRTAKKLAARIARTELAAKVTVKVDRALKERFAAELARFDQAKSGEVSGWDEMYEALDAIFYSDPPLYERNTARARAGRRAALDIGDVPRHHRHTARRRPDDRRSACPLRNARSTPRSPARLPGRPPSPLASPSPEASAEEQWPQFRLPRLADEGVEAPFVEQAHSLRACSRASLSAAKKLVVRAIPRPAMSWATP